MKRFLAIYRAKNLLDVPISFFVNLGVKAVVSDLDRTLAVGLHPEPDERVIEFKNQLEEHGIEFMICSNFPGRHAGDYARKLGVKFLGNAQKFRAGKVRKLLKKNQLKVEDCIFIGDQVIMDVCYTNLLGGRLMLTEPIPENDIKIVQIYRKMLWKIRMKMYREGRVGRDVSALKGE